VTVWIVRALLTGSVYGIIAEVVVIITTTTVVVGIVIKEVGGGSVEVEGAGTVEWRKRIKK
jgi:hypothetical protein